LITLGGHYLVVVIAQIQAFTFPCGGVVSKSDGTADLAKTFFRVTYAEVLVKCFGTINRRLVGTHTFAHIIIRAIATIATIAGTARTC
jgi:hypothetical protein